MESSAVCCTCNKPIGTEAVELEHDVFIHIACFKCAKCGTQLGASDRAHQTSDKTFTCKDHKSGLQIAKQFQDRARKSFKAIKSGTKLFGGSSAKKQKPPAEVGVPTPIPITVPLSSEATDTEADPDERDTTAALVSHDESRFDEFETVLADGVDIPSVHEAQILAPSGASSPMSSVAIHTEAAQSALRRASSAASSHSIAAIGDAASHIPTIASTISGSSRRPLRRKSSQEEYSTRTPSIRKESTQEESSIRTTPKHDETVTETDAAPTDSPIGGELTGNRIDQPAVSKSAPTTPRREVRLEEDIREEDEGQEGDVDEAPSSIIDIEEGSALERQTSDAAPSTTYDGTSEEEGMDKDPTLIDEDDEEDEEEKQMRAAADPLNMLTTAVARELEVLPQSASRSIGPESEGEDDEQEQPWVYPPAYSGVSPIQVSVVDPDHMWMFIEGPLLERMAHSKVGGARRAKFVASEALRPLGPTPIYSRYRNPYLHIYLIKCDSLPDYIASTKARLKAFKEDVERREDSEWLVVLVETTPETKRVLERIRKEFAKERIVSVSVSEDARSQIPAASVIPSQKIDPTKFRRAGDGQWGDLAQRVGTCIVRAYDHRVPLYQKSIDEEIGREFDVNYFNVFSRYESLAFASLQCDRFEEALELYVDLNVRFKQGLEQKDPLIEKVVRCGMIDESGSSVRRLASYKLLFPAVSAKSTEQDAVRAQIHRTFPARIFDVERLPFRDLIGTSTVSGIQLQMYLLSRVVLCMLALGRAREAIDTSRQFVYALRNNLRLAYPSDHTTIDAWVIAASLEIVAAGHACASVFASEVDPADRVGMCLAQAGLLERSRYAMEQISRRETKEFGETNKEQKYARRVVPALALKPFPHLVRDCNLPLGLARALFASPESFRTMYARLLEASAAHYVAAGRFRFAASITHMRARVLFETGAIPRKDAELLFEDAGRWWGGGPKTVVTGEGTAALSAQTRHDDWPSLKAETCLFVGRTERVAQCIREIRPSFRRRELAMRVAQDILGGKDLVPDMLVPVECTVDAFAAKLTEDEEWSGQVRLAFSFKELEAFLKLEVFTRCIVRFRSASVLDSFYRDLESVGMPTMKDGVILFDVEQMVGTSTSSPTPLGTYKPMDVFLYIGSMRLRGLLARKQQTVIVTERPFPYECSIMVPSVVVSGTAFTENAGENDIVSERQELVLTIRPRRTRNLVPLECEATMTCTDPSIQFSETKDGKVATNSLSVRFDGQTERRFSLVVGSGQRQSGGQTRLVVEMKTTGDGRKANTFVQEITFCAPVKVSHEVRFAGGEINNDTGCISIAFERNLGEKAHECVEIVSCTLTSGVSSDELGVKTAPVSPFPAEVRPQSPVRQTFFIENLDQLVPQRVGGRSLILLKATAQIRLYSPLEGSESSSSLATLSWIVPLVLRRAEVVRTRWKEGEAPVFSSSAPAIEHAMFGIDWKELDNEVEAAPVIEISDDPSDLTAT